MPYGGYHADRVKWALVLLLFSLVGYSEGHGAAEDDSQTWHLPDGAVARLGKGDFRSVAFLGNDRFLRVITGSGVWVYEVATSRTLAFFPTGRVNSIAVSPDGTTVATGSDHTVQLWEAVTGEYIATLEGHEAQVVEVVDNHVWALSFSPDGVLLASGAEDGIKLWDVATHTEVATWPARMDPGMSRITFSPDGTTIFARAGGCDYRLWDVETTVEIDTPVLAPLRPGQLQSRGGATLSPDATLVACTVWNWEWDTVDRVEVYDLRTGEKIVTLRANRCLEGLLFSPDGTSLACRDDRGFQLWDVESWESIPIERDQESALSLSFTPDGTTLADARRDGTIKLWDVASGKSIATIEAHEAQVLSVSFSSDGAILASGSSDGTVKLWDTETWQGTTTFPGHEGDFSAVAFSPDGTTLATGSDNGVELWNMDTLNAVRLTQSPVYRVVYSPDGTTLATGWGRRIDLWNLSTGQRSNIIGCSTGGSPFAFAHDGTLAVGCEETIRFLDVVSGDWVATVDGLASGVASVAVSPDGSLAAGLRDGTVHLRDAQKGEWVGMLEAEVRGLWVLFSPDGAILASVSSGTVHLWDVTSQERVAVLEGQGEWWRTPMAFSPDGTIFAYGSRGESKLWDIAEQTAIASFGGHAGDWVRSVSFSPDGETLASSSVNMILLWDVSAHIRSTPSAIQSPVSPLTRPTALLGNFPNPFNTTTLIEYHLAEPGGARLVIHNALGQPVHTLVDDHLGAGHHAVEWDARDDGGTVVASGVYLARLSHPRGAQTRRLMFLK